MTRRFVDTFYYVALLNPRDGYHQRALEFHSTLTGLTVTTDAVLLEVADAFAATGLRSHAAELIRTERLSPDVTVVGLTSDLLDKGLALYADRPDKHWSLTDCVSFVVMDERGVAEALTADHHFAQAGFRPLFAEPE